MAITQQTKALHGMSSKPIKHVPLADLPDNLRDRYRGRRGIELYENFTTQDLDGVAIDAIPRDLLTREADLMQTKWFDYRTLHPWQATALFLEAYRSEHAWIMRKREDVTTHWFRKGISCSKLHNAGKHQMVAIWKARQAADSIGCPYDFYCRELLDWAEKRNWTHLPHMNQVYSEAHIEVVKEFWERGKRDRLRTAHESCFHRDAGDEWHQKSYRDFLIEQVARRPVRDLALASVIFKHEHLSEDQAAQHFGWPVVEKARAAARVLFPEKIEDLHVNPSQ